MKVSEISGTSYLLSFFIYICFIGYCFICPFARFSDNLWVKELYSFFSLLQWDGFLLAGLKTKNRQTDRLDQQLCIGRGRERERETCNLLPSTICSDCGHDILQLSAIHLHITTSTTQQPIY